jgi:hypothetical protein
VRTTATAAFNLRLFPPARYTQFGLISLSPSYA